MATIKTPVFSVLIPTYNGADFITKTLDSLYAQTYKNFEVIVSDDASTDNTIKIIENYVKKFKIKNLKLKTHRTNLGYPGNLEQGRQYCMRKFLYLLGQDDILSPTALKTTFDAFQKYPKAGAVTRPYYWFHNQVDKSVRIKKQLNSKQNTLVNLDDSKDSVIRVFDSLDQLSGLAYKRSLINIPFHPDIFPCHIYPFADIFKKHPIVFLKNYNTAVRIASSQTRKLSSIYNKSPLQSWVDMVTNLNLPKYLVTDFIAKNYVGLIQIKNYSSFRNLIREIILLVKYRPKNLFGFQFWLFSLATIIIPPFILIPLVDWYKDKIYSTIVKQVRL
jgi:glycosyltransferase involved in cell wall biosynthesis